MEVAVLGPLNSLEDSLNTLITSLTTTNTFNGATAATHDILAADDALTSALTLLKEHQDNYKTILKLKAEAETLRSQLKDTIRTCNTLRSEIGQINIAILEDEDEDEEQYEDQDTNSQDQDGTKGNRTQEIDYDTLLAFAARIGKHNAAAAREAEQESARRRAQAARNKSSQMMNGDLNTIATGTAMSAQDESMTQTATTQESQAALSAINEVLMFQRAASGMAFPAPDHLRMGMLGQLQLLREQEGEEAVDREVSRLVRTSEMVQNRDEAEAEAEAKPEQDQTESVPEQERSQSISTGQAHTRLEQVASLPPKPPPPPPPPPKEQKKVTLDFDEFNSDEDD